jgi:hypothetical protein
MRRCRWTAYLLPERLRDKLLYLPVVSTAPSGEDDSLLHVFLREPGHEYVCGSELRSLLIRCEPAAKSRIRLLYA